MIELHINADDLRQVPHFLGLQKHDIERAMLRAINKTARWLRTRIAREVATELNVKVGLARNSLQLRMASRHGLNASVGLNPKASRIKAVDLGQPKQNKAGVRVGRHSFRGAFIATMPSGHTGVFRRKGKARLPIQEMHVSLTAAMADAMESITDQGGMAYLQKTFAHELQFIGAKH